VAHLVTFVVTKYQLLLSTVVVKTVGTLNQYVTLFTRWILGIFVFGIQPDTRIIFHIMRGLSERLIVFCNTLVSDVISITIIIIVFVSILSFLVFFIVEPFTSNTFC